MKKYSRLVFLVALNLIHASMHVFQAIQSLVLMSYSINHKPHEETWVHKVLENPWMSIVWFLILILTVYTGIKDFKHHKHHKD